MEIRVIQFYCVAKKAHSYMYVYNNRLMYGSTVVSIIETTVLHCTCYLFLNASGNTFFSLEQILLIHCTYL